MTVEIGKKTLKDLPLPWRVKNALGAFDEKDDPEQLFDGDDSAFKARLATSKVYAEYGVGKSTKWVLGHTNAEVLAVDTDFTWIAKVREGLPSAERFHAVHVDLGPLAGWGRPKGYTRREFFADYTDTIWKRHLRPDTVLVDGRFRVCCFFTSLKFADPGTRIIFDDYAERPNYHLVEEFVSPCERDGRQAHFDVPAKETLDIEAIDALIDRFRFVMD